MFDSNIENEKSFSKEIENVSEVSTLFTPDDFRNCLKNILIDIMNKLIFAYLYIYSLRNKFDLLSEEIKGSIDVLMISETKLVIAFQRVNF